MIWVIRTLIILSMIFWGIMFAGLVGELDKKDYPLKFLYKHKITSPLWSGLLGLLFFLLAA